MTSDLGIALLVRWFLIGSAFEVCKYLMESLIDKLCNGYSPTLRCTKECLKIVIKVNSICVGCSITFYRAMSIVIQETT